MDHIKSPIHPMALFGQLHQVEIQSSHQIVIQLPGMVLYGSLEVMEQIQLPIHTMEIPGPHHRHCIQRVFQLRGMVSFGSLDVLEVSCGRLILLRHPFGLLHRQLLLR
jgi:hypothetical protein